MVVNGQVCYKLNVQLTCQVPRPPRSRESNDPFEEKRCHYMKSLRNILSSSYGGERASVLQIECTTHLSSATPSKVTWIQWPLWGEKVSLHEKFKEHLVLKLWWWTGQVCYKLNAQLTCQVPRPPRSRESNDPFEVTWPWRAWHLTGELYIQFVAHLPRSPP